MAEELETDPNTSAKVPTVPPSLVEEVPRWQRVTCPTCRHQSMFYCPVCLTPLGAPNGIEVPTVPLPFARCDIILKDAPKKATGIHAKLLAPDQVRLVDLFTNTDHALGKGGSDDVNTATVRQVPKYDPETTYVLYPDEESLTLAEASALRPVKDLTFIIIDSPWKKSANLRRSTGLADLRSLRLSKPPASLFWRYHDEGVECVSSIETLALLNAEINGTAAPGGPFNDPLLFFFVRQYAQISLAQTARAAVAGVEQPDLPMDPEAKRRRQDQRRQKERKHPQIGTRSAASAAVAIPKPPSPSSPQMELAASEAELPVPATEILEPRTLSM